MSSGLIFANASVKARDTALLSKDKLIRLTDAATLADAVKILTESGYGGGAVPERAEDYPALLEKERAINIEFVKKLAPEGCGIECFFLDADYHNLKVLLKEKLLAGKSAMRSCGIYDISDLKLLVESEKSDSLSVYMQSAARKLLETADVSPATIDETLDKAYFEEITNRVKKSRSPLLKEYFSLLADGRNALTFMRVKKAGLSVKKLSTSFVEGGKIKKESFLKTFDAENGVLSLAPLFGARKALEEGATNPVVFEKKLDEALVQMLTKAKDDMFSVAPMAYFLYAKELELKSVAVILTGVNNNAPKDAIKERVRQIYA